jgi:hypothetical protein
VAIPKEKAIKRIENRIVDISEVDAHLKVLIYGRNGTQKTRTAATAPKVLIVDVDEKGTKSARKIKGAKVIQVKSWNDIVYVYWYLKAGNHKHESVVIDTITGMQNVCMKHVLKEAEDRDPDKDPKTATMRDWGKLAQLMKEELLNYRNLPMHVIFLAQERTVDDPDNETTERVPDLSPGTRATATACVDIIGRIYQREVRVVSKTKKKEVKGWEARLLVGPHDEYTTKDRTGSLGRIVRNPTIPMMLEAADLSEVQSEVKEWEV